MTKNEALALLEAMTSTVATRWAIEHGLAQEQINQFAEEIKKAMCEGVETRKSNEEIKRVFSDIFKKYGLPDADFLKWRRGEKTEGG